MVNFVCQSDWAVVPTYVVKYYSGEKNVSVRMFLDEINIYISAFWVKQTAIHDWVGLIQSVEGPTRTKNWPPPSRKEFCRLTAFTLKLQYWHSLCLQSARSTYSGVDSFHAFSITWAKSLKQSLSPHTHTQTSRHTQRKEKPMRVYNKLLLPSLFPSFFLSSLPSIFPEFIQGKDR